MNVGIYDRLFFYSKIFRHCMKLEKLRYLKYYALIEIVAPQTFPYKSVLSEHLACSFKIKTMCVFLAYLTLS